MNMAAAMLHKHVRLNTKHLLDHMKTTTKKHTKTLRTDQVQAV